MTTAPSAGRHLYSDDFFQYCLGAYIDVDTDGIDPDSLPLNVQSVSGDPIFDGLDFALQEGDGANNQCCSSTFISTNYFIDELYLFLANYMDAACAPTGATGN